MSLQNLLDQDASLSAIAAHLDALSHAERVVQTTALGRGAQRKLYYKAAGPLALTDIVPSSVGDQREVRHVGQNTLPLPGLFRRFEKRFCRPPLDNERLFGYNEGITRGIIGPGFFVTVSTIGNKVWFERGPLVVDYYQVPDGPVVPGWPKVIPNSRGLQMLVYQGTRDFLRKVSAQVTIGAAYKGEKALDHYFTLVRDEATALLEK